VQLSWSGCAAVSDNILLFYRRQPRRNRTVRSPCR
jgi:hypothetical protein